MLASPPTPARELSRSRSIRRARERSFVRVVAGLAALVAALTSSAEPTGVRWADLVWCALFAASVTLAASRSRRYPWLWMTGLATMGAIGSGWVLLAGSALGCALVGVFVPNRNRMLGAVVGAFGSLALLHQADLGFHGLSTLIAVVAVVPVLWSGYEHSPRVVRRIARRAVLVGVIAVVVATAVSGIMALLARGSLDAAVGDARAGLRLISDGEQEAGAARLDEASAGFATASDQVDGIWTWPARVVPIVGHQATAVATMAAAGEHVTAAAADAAATAPYQQLKAADGGVDLATIVAMQGPTASAVAELRHADDELRAAQTPWLLGPVATAMDDITGEVADALPEAELAAQALAASPALLGAEGPRTYLVLFTSPAESRYLGGFVGSHGLLTATDGEVSFTGGGTMPELLAGSGVDPGSLTLEGHDEFLTRYGRYAPTRNLQNLTASPDMATTAEASRSLYQQITGVSVDGVLVVDPFALAALLELTGPVEVPGLPRPLTADNALTYLLHEQYIDFEGDKAARRDGLDAAGQATFEALTSRILPGPRQLGRVLGPMVEQKHLLVYPFASDEHALFERLGGTGRFAPDLGADFVSLRTADANANKIDYFLHRALDYDATYDPTTGQVRATATATLRNDAPSGGLPDYIIGGQLNSPIGSPLGTSTLYVSLFSPLAALGATLDGRSIGFEHQVELGSQVYTTLVTIPPGGTVTLVLELEGALSTGTTYPLELLSQPLVHADELTVQVRSGSPGWRVDEAEGLVVADDGATTSTTLATDQRYTVELTRG